MRASRMFLLVVCAVWSVTSSAQQSEIFGETMEVRVGTIDVVVTDRSGQAIHGLKQEDFQLIIDGKPEKITAFDEVRGAVASRPAAGAPAALKEQRRPRHIIFFLDDYSLSFHRRNEALESLNRFLERSWQDGDQAMLALWRGELRIPLTFTSDRARIEEAVRKHVEVVATGYEYERRLAHTRIRNELQTALATADFQDELTRKLRQAYSNSLSIAGSFSEEQFVRAKNLADDLKEVIRGAGGIEGRKALVLLGENFPQLPGLAMYEFVNDVFTPYSNELETLVQPHTRASNRSLAHIPATVARLANENGVAIYTLYSGDTTAEAQIEQRSMNATTRFLEYTNTAGTFSKISSQTGGLAIVGSRNFDLATAHIERDLANYYTLTWKPGAETKPRTVDVRISKPGYVVRWRREFVGRSLDDDIASHVLSHLFHDTPEKNDQISIQVGKAVSAGRKKIRVPVEISFPTTFLTLIPQEGKQVGGFDVVLASSDTSNRLSVVTRQKNQTSWQDGKVPPMITYSVEILLRDQPGMISVAIVDAASKTPVYRRLEVPRWEYEKTLTLAR